MIEKEEITADILSQIAKDYDKERDKISRQSVTRIVADIKIKAKKHAETGGFKISISDKNTNLLNSTNIQDVILSLIASRFSVIKLSPTSITVAWDNPLKAEFIDNSF